MIYYYIIVTLSPIFKVFSFRIHMLLVVFLTFLKTFVYSRNIVQYSIVQSRDQQTLPVKCQIINILGFLGHILSLLHIVCVCIYAHACMCKKVNALGKRPLSLERAACKAGLWLASRNLDFSLLPEPITF